MKLMTTARNQTASGGVVAVMPSRSSGLRRAPAALPSLLLAALLAACSAGAGGTPTPSGSPGPTPTPSPSPAPSQAVKHSTDPAVLILRVEQAGGFVAPSFMVTRTPQFSLYGDGTVIYQLPPDPNAGLSLGPPPLARAQMNGEQVDALLAFALTAGTLEAAKEFYPNPRVADAPDTVFTIATDALTKTVTVQALGIAPDPTEPDAPTIQALARLWEVLSTFADQVRRGNATDAGIYQPTAYRGILSEGQPQGQGIDWPWSDLSPDDFVAAGDFGYRVAALTSAQAKTLSLTPQGGLFATPIFAPDRTPYTIALRPLLPDEAK
jgi:hypothetical protein